MPGLALPLKPGVTSVSLQVPRQVTSMVLLACRALDSQGLRLQGQCQAGQRRTSGGREALLPHTVRSPGPGPVLFSTPKLGTGYGAQSQALPPASAGQLRLHNARLAKATPWGL